MISSINLMVLSKTGLYRTPILLGIPCWLNNIKLTTYLHLNIHLSMIGLDKSKRNKPKRIKNPPVLRREKWERNNYSNSTKRKKHK